MPEKLPNPTFARLTSELEQSNAFNVPIRNHCSCIAEASPPSSPPTGECTDKNLSKCLLGVRTNQVAGIQDWLYLSGARAIRPPKLKELGVTCVVNCTVELPYYPIDDIEICKIHVSDDPHSNLEQYFDEVADKIEEVRLQGGRTLVHCVAGLSRSPAFVMAYLIKHMEMSLRQAFFHVRSVRQNARPNGGFFSQLIEFERRIRGGVTSVSLIHDEALRITIPDVCEEELKILKDTRWAKMIHERKNFENLYS